MKNEQIETLLKKAKLYKDNWQFDEALANLHQAVNLEPGNDTYKYLLASTYLEAKNTEAASKYADEILEKSLNSKETLELKGLICEAEKKYTEAETFYLKSLEIDPNFLSARFNLVQLYSNVFFPNRYTSYEKGYKKVFEEPKKIIEHSYFLLDKLDAFTKRMIKKEILNNAPMYGFTSRLLSMALFKVKEHKKCLEILEKSIIYRSLFNKIFPGFFINDEINIYKMYYLLKDEMGMKKYQEKMREGYDSEKDYQETIKRITEEVQAGNVYL